MLRTRDCPRGRENEVPPGVSAQKCKGVSAKLQTASDCAEADRMRSRIRIWEERKLRHKLVERNLPKPPADRFAFLNISYFHQINNAEVKHFQWHEELRQMLSSIYQHVQKMPFLSALACLNYILIR